MEFPSPVSSYTLTVYFLPGRSSLRFTEVAVRGRSVNSKLAKHLKHCIFYRLYKVPGISNQQPPSNFALLIFPSSFICIIYSTKCVILECVHGLDQSLLVTLSV